MNQRLLLDVVFIIVSSHRSKSNLTGEFHLLVNVAVACFDPLLILLLTIT